jgi:hypothetical protein
MAKARSHFIYIGCDEKFGQILESPDAYRLPDDGRTYYIFHQLEYDRRRKPKRLFALFQFFGSRSVKKDPIEELRKYDAIYAIDTNYLRGSAITTASTADWVDSKGIFAIHKLFTRKWPAQTDKPEREAWAHFMDAMKAPTGTHNGLVVDSDLDSLIKINRHEEELTPGFPLPPNWQLNYATSDAADDFVLVRMMRLCEDANKRGKEAEYAPN